MRENYSAYAFITFYSMVTAETVCLIGNHQINGSQVNIQKVREFPIFSVSGLYFIFWIKILNKN